MGFNWGYVFVTGVTGLITFVPLTTQVFIFWPWLSFHETRNPYIWLAPFNLSVLSIYVNYYLGVFTDPGPVPPNYDPVKVEKESEVEQFVKDGKKRKPRWCPVCKVFKPPRSHHCSVCNRCILKMDHHCPWLNNCVGHRNQGHFLRFLLSVVAANISCLTLLAFRIRDVSRYNTMIDSPHYFATGGHTFYTPLPETKEIIFMIVNLIILFFLLLSVGILAIWQSYYVAKGVTTIESYENSKIDDLIRQKKISSDIVYPYDLGVLANFKVVLGRRIWAWWIPQPAEGDGIRYQVSKAALEHAKESGKHIEWPPTAYLLHRKYPNGREKKTKENHLVPQHHVRNHVRRGSEGYIVREWTPEEREEMVRIAKAQAAFNEVTGREAEPPLAPRGPPGPRPLIQLNLEPPKLGAAEDEEDEDYGEGNSSDEWTENSYDDDYVTDEEYESDGERTEEDEPLLGNGHSDDEPIGLRHRNTVEDKGTFQDGAVQTGCTGVVKEGL